MKAAAFLALGLAAATVHAAPPPVSWRPVLNLSGVVEIANAGDASGRLFLVQQAGRIHALRPGGHAMLFLDIAGLIQGGGEQGLLGLAFHPRYAQNGFFYVYYTRPPTLGGGGNEIVVARYRRSDTQPDVADASSASIVLAIPHPGQTNHNGGKLAFGPDGLLYIAVGDGGGGGDPFDAAANLGDLRGKILRIDVDAAQPYAVPASNPHANQPGRRGEILFHGLRNPWRFSFDRATGDLFIADVGQNAWEEVSFLSAAQVAAGGLDLGWSRWEGNHCYPPGSTSCAATPGMVFPILEYGHALGESVTGGFRYRGRRFPELRGFYVYGDFVSGRVWAAEPSGSAWSTTQVATIPNLSTFGEDEEGELHAASLSAGAVYRLGPVDSDGDGMSDAFELRHFGDSSATAGADSDGDGVTNEVEYFEGLVPVVKDNDVFADARLFSMQQYRDFLGREGDAGGIAFWAAQLGAGMARATVATNFLRSPEFEGLVAPAARLYFAYFRRVPEYEGITFWIRFLREGGRVREMSEFFTASEEFRQTYGAISNEAFVDLVYRNVLGREADPAGRAHWLGRLQSGELSRGQVMLAFSESEEFRGRMASEVFVTMAYVGMLRRAPEPAGFAFWVGWLDGGRPGESLVQGFLDAPEYRARFLGG